MRVSYLKTSMIIADLSLCLDCNGERFCSRSQFLREFNCSSIIMFVRFENVIIGDSVFFISSNSEPFMTPEPNMSDIKADDWWANVEAEMKMFEEAPEQQTRSLWYIFIAGFIGGLIALVTPCVWPLIPMTVSFFLKQNKSRSKAIGAATTYGISIIVIYVLLGLLVTIIFGASALNELATSAGFNIAFFILLVVFAVSFMGGFELTLPASWSNKIDSKVDSTTGYLSIFFMAFTLALVSFSCTGPIIGTLLVEAAATSNFVSPAIGMFGFALALALPFSLFAMFPTMLKSMPKSGGWMNTVKGVLGFASETQASMKRVTPILSVFES